MEMKIQNVTLEAGKEQRYLLDLPRKTYAYSQLVVVLKLPGKGALPLYPVNLLFLQF